MSSHPIRILDIEDNTGDAFFIKQLLDETAAKFPFLLRRKEYLSSAMQLLAENPFDIILCDLHLPDSRGLDTLSTVHSRAPDLPIIVLTSLDDESTAMQAMNKGAQDYLVKGQFDNHGLLRAIRYAIERKKNEVARKRLEERLQQSQKLEAIGRLAGGIAHNFNNILQVIAGYAHLLKLNGKDNPQIAAYTPHIITATSRASLLIKKMLNFSRQREMVPVAVDLHALIKESIAMLQPIIGTRITVDCRLEAPNPKVAGDEDALGSALLNLGMNAADAMAENGTLTLSTRNGVYQNPNPGAGEASMPAQECCIITVADTGCGMDRATLDCIFEPFFTTKEPGKGVGLGLADVYGCIKQHHGHITAESVVGQGTTFSIALPLLVDGEPAAGGRAAHGNLAAGTGDLPAVPGA